VIPRPLAPMILSVLVGCVSSPNLTPDDVRDLTHVVIVDFFSRYSPQEWPHIYVTDEYLGASLDSAFLARLPTDSVPTSLATRADVEVSPDLIVGGALLLQPSRPVPSTDVRAIPNAPGGGVDEVLTFTSTSDFGGAFEYHLERSLGGWRIRRITVLWQA